MPDSPESMIAVHGQLGEIKGILSTVVVELGRRVSVQESTTTQLRTDLSAVNDNLTTKINNVDGRVMTNTANITELRSDIQETRERQNAALPRTAQILSPLVAVGSLIWAIIVGAK